mmetsp:Transcript_37739/g.112948  ORF Transcript_37739/g.112948 Transcript_37739/m.112948 type:complete len:164 (-) Transcript_37739:489-980(-)
MIASLPSFLRRIALAALPLILFLAVSNAGDAADTNRKDVVVETVSPGLGPLIVNGNIYNSLLTLYIKKPNGELKKAGFSTRQADGAKEDTFYEIEPAGGEMIEGLRQGVLQMREGERAKIHIPSALAYGGNEIGTQGSKFYVPPFSDVVFDVQIAGRLGGPEL